MLYLFNKNTKEDVMAVDPIYGVTNEIDWFKVRELLNDTFLNNIQKWTPCESKRGE